MSGPLPPSVYVSRLRRAFFLRVHPDRFRSHDDSVRRKQAQLMQALNDRMSWSDFVSYNYSGNTSSIRPHSAKNPPLEYHLEHRDGTLLNQTIRLNDSVENILSSMAQALRRSGAASIPPPPKKRPTPASSTKHSEQSKEPHVQWAPQSNPQNQNRQNGVDHSFDVNTTKGRDLIAFLRSLDRQQVEERQSSRMDANTAAMMGRRLYGFQSIDGTSLHWSSASFVMIMTRLIDLFEEHHSKFFVNSFYPLRLVFTNDDFHEALDLYGGHLHLHPGYTSIQWLDILRQVTPEKLEIFQHHRDIMEESHKKIQTALGVKIKKGFSCSSKAYYFFLTDLADNLRPPSETQESDGSNIAPSSSSVALEPIQITVEAAEACRFRTHVTKEGHIRVGAGMDANKIVSAISKHSTQARRRMKQEQQERQISDQHAQQVQWELGLARKVYKAGTFRISHEQFQDCLRRIASLGQDSKETLKVSLSGNSLGVVASGQFCHLGDDGSVVIPHDFAVEEYSM